MSKLKLGTPESDLSMSVTKVLPWDRTVEFTITPPSPFSHAMTLYVPSSHVSFDSLSTKSSLGDMRISNADGDTMFIIRGEQ